MVSIPDWSRFGRMVEVQKDNTPLSSRYRRQREKEATKQAEESGYITQVDKAYLQKHILGLSEEVLEKKRRTRSFLDSQEEELDLSNVFMVRLHGAHLRTVGEIGLCQHIRICILSNNFIIRFDALDSCKQLVKLDLHNNQIQHVPPASFWATKRYLRILNLHDNPIGDIETLHHLALCPDLHALTLHGTPLSLKRNYRHHVVNSIWTLKALDSYVISDEEIIEDAEFHVHFATKHPNFAVNLCPHSVPEASYEDEMRVVVGILAEVNYIMSHNSPVLIIQRYFRGHMTRKHLQAMADTRTCVTFSASSGTVKKSEKDSQATEDKPPPPSSPVEPPPRGVVAKTTGGEESSVASTRLDYDTYMAHRRPGSILHTEDSSVKQRDMLSPPVDKEIETHRMPGTPVSDPDQAPRHIFVNMSKLQAGTLQSLQDEAAATESAMQSPHLIKDEKLKVKVPTRRSKKKKEVKKRRVIKDVREFFGPVVSGKTPEPKVTQEEEGELPVIDFKLRLKGNKQVLKYHDATTDMIIAKRDAGRIVRAAEYDMHEFVSLQPEPVIENKSQPNMEKRIFNRVQGTMGFSCLRAVEQAYKDRSNAEKKVQKIEYVMNMRDQKEAAKERVRLFNEERRNKTLKEREKETKKTAEVLEKRELQRIGYIDKSTELRNKSCNFNKTRRGELTFISDFNAQNTSVSNALLRHDRQARKEDKHQAQNQVVQDYRSTEQEQKEVVKKYLEHRKLMRQTESALSRAALDTKMLREANEQLMQAKARVAHQKELTKQATEPHFIVPQPTHFVLPPVKDDKTKPVRRNSLDRWGTGIYARKNENSTKLGLELSRHPATALT